MKTIFNIVTLASVMALAVACGKNSSGGSGDGYKSKLLSNNANLSSNAVQAVQRFQQWYENNNEGRVATSDGYNLNYGNFKVIRNSSTASYSNGCEVEDIEVFGVVIGQWMNCTNFNSGSNNGTLSECRVAISPSNSSLKDNNPILKKIYEGKMGQLVNATNTGTVYTFQFLKSDNSVVTYVIDSQFHSALQPMQVTDLQNGTVSTVVDAKGYNVSTSLSLCN